MRPSPALAAKPDVGPEEEAQPPRKLPLVRPGPPHPLVKFRSRWEKRAWMGGLLPTRGLTLPDFLGIGAQRAGTTWLWENLRCHPDLFVASPKEIHYWDWRFHQPLHWYSQLFAEAGERCKGEVTPGYLLLSSRRIQLIRKLMPDVRLILLLRNPIERAWSHVRLILRTQELDPTRLSREWYLEQLQGRTRERGNYPAFLRNWEAHFPAEQLFAGFFEDVVERPQSLLTDVFRHLGVSEEVDWSQFPWRESSNAARPLAMPDEYRELLTELYGDDIRQLTERFGERTARWLPD